MIRIRAIVILTSIAFTATAGQAAAPASKDPNDPLSARVRALEQELGSLRTEMAKIKTGTASQQASANAGAKPEEAGKTPPPPDLLDWMKKVQVYGDLRYRYEYIDDETKTTDRDRNRIRARVGLTAKVNDEWNLGFRLATSEGTQGGDPISTNQTLGGSWGKRPFWLDLAFLDYRPSALNGLDILAGKMEFPFYKPGRDQLIWDTDLTPEGGAMLYTMPMGDATTLNLGAGGFWLVERSTDVDTSFWAAQGYLKQKISDSTYALGGVSGYWYGHIQGQQALSLQWESPTASFFGNSNAGGLYTSKYELFEAFAEMGTQIEKMPVALFGDYVVNTVAVDKSQDTGWMIGVTINKARNAGSWQLDYDYRDIQADAVVGQFTESDFLGGGTGGRGHRFGCSYVLFNNVMAGLTYYLDELTRPGTSADYKRLELDLQVKF
jgi:hypothetical protein